jgi:alpha-1,2-mannosyltransferase
VALGVVAAAGVALMIWTPIPLMPEHQETAASLWRQLAGGSYVWWAIAVIVVSGAMSWRQTQGSDAAVDETRVPAVN